MRPPLLLLCAVLASAVPGGWMARAQQSEDLPAIQITERDCRRLVRHFESGDVEFKPGVDVRGRPVVSPDLERRAQIEVPETLVIPISVDFCDRVDRTTGSELCRREVATGIGPVDEERYKAEGVVGTVVVRNKGRAVYFNGQPLHDEDKLRVELACERLLAAR